MCSQSMVCVHVLSQHGVIGWSIVWVSGEGRRVSLHAQYG